MIRIPLTEVQNNMYNFRLRAEGRTYSTIELCRIEQVDTTNKVVSAYFFGSGILRENIPYCYPYYSNGVGIIMSPTPGALGIALFDSNRSPIIVSYTSPKTVKGARLSRNIPELGSRNIPDLLEGEILIEGEGRSFIKLDRLGGVTLSSALFAVATWDHQGNYSLDIETGNIRVNGTLTESYSDNYAPILEIVKGKHTYKPTQLSGDGVELYYRVTVLKDQEEVGFIGVDSAGNLHLTGKIINWGEEDGSI